MIDLDKCRESAGWLAMKGHMHEAQQIREMADEIALARAVVEAAGKHVELSSDHEPRFGPCSCFLCAAYARGTRADTAGGGAKVGGGE